jgi:hypothetical protein
VSLWNATHFERQPITVCSFVCQKLIVVLRACYTGHTSTRPRHALQQDRGMFYKENPFPTTPISKMVCPGLRIAIGGCGCQTLIVIYDTHLLCRPQSVKTNIFWSLFCWLFSVSLLTYLLIQYLFIYLFIYLFCLFVNLFTVESVLTVTCLKQSSVLCGHSVFVPRQQFLYWNNLQVLNGHLTYTATSFWSPGWPLKTDLTVFIFVCLLYIHFLSMWHICGHCVVIRIIVLDRVGAMMKARMSYRLSEWNLHND